MKMLFNTVVRTSLLFAALFCTGSKAEESFIIQRASARVIIDNDFAGDPDGLAALAHQVLSKKTQPVLITVTGLDPNLAKFTYGTEDTAQAGAQKATALLRLLNLEQIPVAYGFDYLERQHQAPSAAARAIVDEAMKDSELPLFFTCGGPLTNLAEALKLAPDIAKRMTVIWIGGGDYPKGEHEYNLATDLQAAKYVIEQTYVPVWQIPVSAYRQMQYSVAEMRLDFKPISPSTEWLYNQYTHLPPFVDMGGSLTMGDHPLVTFTALSTQSSLNEMRFARAINADGTYAEELNNRTIRVFHSVDARLTFADFLAVMKLNAHSQ
ncbi:nucleoside hydrolase [Aestuariibacter sp. GS-14]|uniref:nucleoside hydrolase n=1 Tax=Aestuariibacter sp. GS-14 TaxID=2590670 RepID=UPI0015E86DEE|nr:nucleoside hydrolase [Aestuariibacter sp. GS-14]